MTNVAIEQPTPVTGRWSWPGQRGYLWSVAAGRPKLKQRPSTRTNSRTKLKLIWDNALGRASPTCLY
jgi:hypothetical protein